jgi:hypothetical protein
MVLQTFWPFCACQSGKTNLEGLASETHSWTQVNVIENIPFLGGARRIRGSTGQWPWPPCLPEKPRTL